MANNLSADLNDIAIFHAVVRDGGFTAAARSLGLTKSTVSERVARLEERLGVRLLERTTRTVRTTGAGATYFERAERIVAEAQEAEAAISDQAKSPHGLIRIFAPLVAARAFLNGCVAAFLREYPRVQIEMVAEDRSVDLVAERFDIGIHAYGPIDPNATVRRVGSSSRYYVASPAYVGRRGMPTHPDDLVHHDLVGAGEDRQMRWQFERGKEKLERDVELRYVVTSFELAAEAAEHGAGISVSSSLLVGQALHDGRLVRVLPEWSATTLPLSIVLPSNRHLTQRVRLFIDFSLEKFAELPSWRFSTGVAPSP